MMFRSPAARAASRFTDRREAGRELARALNGHAGHEGAVIFALPRGGVPVGYEIAAALAVPLDIFQVRKLGVPGREELAMGAIASGGIYVLNEETIEQFGIARDQIAAAIDRELCELERREPLYRDDRPRMRVTNKTVILVDDGLATGSSMHAAIAALRGEMPARIIVAVPVAPRETVRELRCEADEVLCLDSPEPFIAVGAWYADFTQTTDAEVQSLLQSAARRDEAV
jgi:putative phosphoribosyl transferase